MFTQVKVGDKVTRMLCGLYPRELTVTEVTDEQIICGAWVFDRATGAEIDDELGWGPMMAISYIRPGTVQQAKGVGA